MSATTDDHVTPHSLRVPSGIDWPLEGMEADGRLIVDPLFRERLAAENNMPVSALTDSQVARALAILYIDRRLNGASVAADGEHLLKVVGFVSVVIPTLHLKH